MKTSPKNFDDKPFTQMQQDHFWSRVKKTDTCWLWTGACAINGYGILRIYSKTVLAHRLSYYLTYGNPPSGNVLCHTCDVRNCVNPQHLIPGTQTENMHEVSTKNRWNNGKRHVARGEQVGTSILTFESVQCIRDEYANGGISQRALARKYGVSQRQILSIVKGYSWRYNAPNPDPLIQKSDRICSYCGATFTRAVSIYREETEPLCSHFCRREWNRRDIAERFWARVDQPGPDECWNWQGFKHRNGYGNAGNGFKSRLAHRVAWSLVNGDIPAGLHILHSCDNPPCVNPAHLSLGTRSENMQDASRKGRMSTPKPSLRGELHPNAVLTNIQRQEIRDRHAQGESYTMLMKAFGVSKRTVARIVRNI